MLHTLQNDKILFFLANTFGRLVVPIFMLITGYFYFKENDYYVKKKRIKKLFFLWLSWMIVYLPMGMLSIYSNKEINIIVLILKNILGTSVFYSGSWYLIATIFGLITVDFFRMKGNEKIILFFSLFIFLVDLVTTNYDFLINNRKLKDLLIVVNPHSSIITGFLWITISFYIVKLDLENRTNFNLKLVLISLAMLIIEFNIIQNLNLSEKYHDMYVSLPLAAVSLFIYLLNKSVNIVIDTKNIVSLSTLIFFSQFGCIRFVRYTLKINVPYIFFTSCLLTTIVISIVILYLSKKEKFRILKNLY